MKIWAFLATAIILIYSVELGTAGFRLLGYNSFWIFIICSCFGILYLNILYFAMGKLKKISLKKWPIIENWLGKTDLKNQKWIKWCYRKRYLGLFLTATIPHLELVGIAAQKILRLKYGYLTLTLGTIVKTAMWSFGWIKVLEYIVRRA